MCIQVYKYLQTLVKIGLQFKIKLSNSLYKLISSTYSVLGIIFYKHYYKIDNVKCLNIF